MERDGKRPAIVYGYGSYGFSSDPSFSTSLYAWLEQGGVYAIAGVRGGGELGSEWRLAGTGAKKPNTWKDGIACAEYLVANKYSSPGTLSIMGGSAGGIFAGRAITERPELFRAGVIQVGATDSLRFVTTANGITNISEFGSSKDPQGFRDLLAMSTYQNIRDGVAYPAVIFVHGVNDPRVEVWESLKTGARFQAASSSGRPVVLRLDEKAGHGIGSTVSQRLAETADNYAFLLWQMGVKAYQPKAGDKKYALNICTGCSIGESINVDKIANLSKNVLKVPVVKSHFALCGKEGVDLIKNDVATEGVNTLILAACSPRVKFEEFDFPGCLVERVPLRELAVWTQEPKSPDAQLAAEDYTKMGVTKAQKGALPDPYQMETFKTILVIGGGTAGMTAALEAAHYGYQVVLVEKEAQLGGFMNRLYKKIPTDGIYRKPLIVDVDISKTVREVESHPHIKVYKSAKVEKTEGMPGAFDVTISQNGSAAVEKIGSIVLAAGWRPYDPTKLEHLGYGTLKDVVTNVEFEEIARKGKITRPSDGKEAKKVAFIQCALSSAFNDVGNSLQRDELLRAERAYAQFQGRKEFE